MYTVFNTNTCCFKVFVVTFQVYATEDVGVDVKLAPRDPSVMVADRTDCVSAYNNNNNNTNTLSARDMVVV